MSMNMKDTESNFKAYVFAVTEQVEQHISGLDQLAEILLTRPLSFNEKSAVERSLQVIVEAAIGCSKHYLKLKQKPIPSDARGTIERTYELLGIQEPELYEMRGAIGMRNAIIHDYLNLDWKRLEKVLRERKYRRVLDYVKLVLKKMMEN